MVHLSTLDVPTTSSVSDCGQPGVASQDPRMVTCERCKESIAEILAYLPRPLSATPRTISKARRADGSLSIILVLQSGAEVSVEVDAGGLVVIEGSED